MKANELRIGNWVLHVPTNKHMNVSIKDLMLIEGGKYANKYEPIPLTEEWLVRFGFEKVEGNQWYNFYKLDDFKVLIHTKDYSSMINWKDCSIEDRFNWHVHQLQNLYFALTGEELTVKE